MELLDLKLKLFGGEPILAQGYGQISPLKIRDVIRYGYTEYMQSLNLTTVVLKDFVDDPIQLEDLEKDNVNVLDFLITFGGEEIEVNLEKALSLFLGGEAIIDKEKLQILVKTEDNVLVVNRDNYSEIQQVISWQNYIKNFEEKTDNFDPANEETRKFKERMDKLKKQRDEIKKKQNGEEDNEEIDFFDILSAISSKSYSINELNILDMTVYQVYRKFKRLQLIDQYDISIKSILAGAKDIKIKHWSTKD